MGTFPGCGSLSQSKWILQDFSTSGKLAQGAANAPRQYGRWINMSRSWVMLNEIGYQWSADWWFFVMLTLRLTLVINCR
jgi:hypothetical protein